MINILFEVNILLGIIAAAIMLCLYYLRMVKPEISRDGDLFFATIGLIYGSILVLEGWRLDPILMFSQIIVNAILVFTCWENIRLRAITADLLVLYEQSVMRPSKQLNKSFKRLKNLRDTNDI